MRLAACGILGRNTQNSVGIDVEGHLDLGYAAGSWRQSIQIEFTQAGVVPGHRPLALKYMDGDASLHVCRGGKGLGFFDRYRRVARDQGGCDSTQRFNTQGERRYIHQHDAANFARQHACLNRSACGYALHRVDAHFGFASKQILEIAAHGGHACRATDEHDAIDFPGTNACIVQRLFDRFAASLNYRTHQTFQLCAIEIKLEMAWFAVNRCKIRQADMGADAGGEFDLGRFRRFKQTSRCMVVCAHIHAG